MRYPARADGQCERRVLVVAHGNILRAIIKRLKKISDTDIASQNIPTTQPGVNARTS